MREKKQKNQQAFFSKIIWGVLALILLLLFKVMLVNTLVTNGSAISWLEEQTVQTEKESKRVGEEITKFSSLTRISSEANRLGFLDNGSVASLTSEFPLALR